MPVTNKELSNMVKEYLECDPDWERQITFYTNIKDFADLLDKAGRAIEDNDKKCKHQHRLSNEKLKKCATLLQAKKHEFKQATSFEEIHQLVIECTKSEFKKASLYWYDTALRIGVNLKIYPELVYLQAGAKKGSDDFLDIATITQYKNQETGIIAIPKEYFPEPLQRLEAYQIEDFLCGYSRTMPKQ